jgi:flagellar biosynthesis chaperone FliJ
MKKKETFWELLERLDEQAGQFNIHLSEANRYFDNAANKTKMLLARQEKVLHETIAKVRRALKKFSQEMDNTNKGRKKSSGS